MIYFIRDRVSKAIKIGIADDPKKRLATLQTGNPNVLVLMGVVNGGRAEEAAFHKDFRAHHIRGEWFEADERLLSRIFFLIEEGTPEPVKVRAEATVIDDDDWSVRPVLEPPVDSSYVDEGPGTSLRELWEDHEKTVDCGSDVWHPEHGSGTVLDSYWTGADHIVAVQFGSDDDDINRTFLACQSALRAIRMPRALVRKTVAVPSWFEESARNSQPY